MKLRNFLALAILSIFSLYCHQVNAQNSNSITSKIQMEIENLISNYGFLFDHSEIDEWTNLFTEDARIEQYHGKNRKFSGGTTSNESRRINVAIYRKGLNDQGIQTRHFQTNTLLRFIDNNKISSVTNFYVLHQQAKENTPKLVHSGVYEDIFVKINHQWKFLKREIYIDHIR